MKVAGRWRYVYRAIDQFGQVVDVFVSVYRDAKAAWRFFERAIGTTAVVPVEVVTDRAAACPAVLGELLPAAWHCTEAVRQRPRRGRPRPTQGATGTMRGLRQDRSAMVTIRGHASLQNIGRGHDELAVEAAANLR